MSKVSECDNNELLNEFARLHRKDALQDVQQTPFTLEDSERCIQVRGELIRRMSMVVDCDNEALLERFEELTRNDVLDVQVTSEDQDTRKQLRDALLRRMPSKEKLTDYVQKQFTHVSDDVLLGFFLEQLNIEDEDKTKTKYSAYCDRLEAEILRRMSAMPVFPPKPTYEELVKGLSDAIEHLNYCGWGDRWERECAESLRKELPELLKKAQGG
ncbi:MAG: hypothetical protein ACTS8S_00920 [Giesbergeria sp.]